MEAAHQFIINHFDDLESGAVVDAEFIRGESLEPKESEAAATATIAQTSAARGLQRKFVPSDGTIPGVIDENRQQHIG